MIRGRLSYLCLETPREGQATYTHVHEIIDGLKAGGWQVELVATTAGGSACGGAYWQRGLDYIAAQWRLICSLSRVDAVYVRAHFAALPASVFAALRKRPVIQEINGLPDDIFVTYPRLGWLRTPVRASYRLQMRLASHIIVVTDGLRGWAEAESGHERVSIVTNGANTRVFSPLGPRTEVEGAYIVFVGGITAWHGVEVMVEATRDSEWPKGVRLVIIGDGKERKRLQAAISNDEAGRVSWLGRLPQTEAAKWLRGALAALSVTQDTQGHLRTGVAPLKLFEAMASGAAVIVTDLPFQAELVRRERTGLVVPMADPRALARAVAVLAADSAGAKAMGVRGAAYVAEHASWQARADQTGSIIAGVIHGD